MNKLDILFEKLRNSFSQFSSQVFWHTCGFHGNQTKEIMSHVPKNWRYKKVKNCNFTHFLIIPERSEGKCTSIIKLKNLPINPIHVRWNTSVQWGRHVQWNNHC